jgi:UDP-N-acetylmuramoyl-L-alanyl-D-glutamate--2,6-diaminopimelate ligase
LGIPFDIAIFTNLTHEHLDLHGNMDNYRQAKAKLFRNLGNSHFKGVPKTIIVNAEDKNSNFYSNFKAAKKYSVSLNGKGVKGSVALTATDLKPNISGTDFSVKFGEKKEHFYLGLPGSFNVSNALLAIAVGDALKISIEDTKSALKKAEGIEGRMQRIDMGQDFNVYVDYAFTPNAFQEVLSSVREMTKGKIITVFGGPGNRDALTRPLMGDIVTKKSDMVIITDDEPATEDPEKIIEDIKKGIKSNNFEIIRDRKEAINKALGKAEKGDSVIVAGLGPSTVRYTGAEAEVWDDREVVRELLAEMAPDQKVK